MLTHANLAANARQVCALDPHAGRVDRILGVLPMFHVFANTCVLNRTVAAGGEIVMLPRFDAGQALAAIARTRPTALPGVPTMYRALMDHPAFAKTDFSSLRVCISGGAPLPAELADEWLATSGPPPSACPCLSTRAGVPTPTLAKATGTLAPYHQPIPPPRPLLAPKAHPRCHPPS